MACSACIFGAILFVNDLAGPLPPWPWGVVYLVKHFSHEHEDKSCVKAGVFKRLLPFGSCCSLTTCTQHKTAVSGVIRCMYGVV